MSVKFHMIVICVIHQLTYPKVRSFVSKKLNTKPESVAKSGLVDSGSKSQET
jgi:hypothetical protein